MSALIKRTLKAALDDLYDDLGFLELNDLNESVLRHFFARQLRRKCKCNIHVEWKNIDLVITHRKAIDLIEFKYFVHRFSRELFGSTENRKGWASSKNRSEFESSRKLLQQRRNECEKTHSGNVSVKAYLILVFSDPEALEPARKFEWYYRDVLEDRANWRSTFSFKELRIAQERTVTCCLIETK